MKFFLSRSERLVGTAASGCWSHNLFDPDFGSLAVISRYVATHVSLGDDADQPQRFSIFHHGRAATA